MERKLLFILRMGVLDCVRYPAGKTGGLYRLRHALRALIFMVFAGSLFGGVLVVSPDVVEFSVLEGGENLSGRFFQISNGAAGAFPSSFHYYATGGEGGF